MLNHVFNRIVDDMKTDRVIDPELERERCCIIGKVYDLKTDMVINSGFVGGRRTLLHQFLNRDVYD